MDQKTKPWAFPKPHPENTPRGERNKQEFDVAPDTETRAQGASEGKRPARRHRTLIVRARHPASRAGRGIRSPDPIRHGAPPSGKLHVQGPIFLPDAQARVGWRACALAPSPKTRGTQYSPGASRSAR